jgi:hypothetical protein
MQDPKQLYLFNYMDPEYDDMESADYDDMMAMSQFNAEYEAYLDSLDE